MHSERHRPRRLLRAVLPALIAALGASAGPLGAQSYTVAPNAGAITFASTAAQPAPPSQTVTITNSGSTTLGAATLGAVTYSAGATNWLSVSKLYNASTLNAGVTTNLMALSVSVGALAAGTYTATVPVTIAGAASNASVQVTLSVAGPTIALSTNAIAWTPTNAAPTPSTTLKITNTGSSQMTGLARGPIEYLSGPVQNWLSASIFGTINAGQTASFNVSLLKTDLPAGTYSARFPVSSTNATNGPLWVTVTLDQAGPTLVASAQTDFVVVSPTNSSAGVVSTFTVRNGGTSDATGVNPGTITFQEVTGYNWLLASTNTSASLSPNGTRGVTLNVPQAYNLLPGTYHATVPVLSTNADNATPPTATVTLTVGNPIMALSPAAIAATADAATPTPPSQTITIANTGSSMLRNIKRTIAYAPNEPTGWLSISNAQATQIIPGTPVGFTLNFAPSSLPQGTFRATVTVSADLVAPQTVDVTLTRSGASIAVAQTVAINAPPGSGALRTDVPVSNGGAGALTGLTAGPATYAAGQPTGWITNVAMQATTAPTNLQLFTSSTGLAAGTYNATIPVMAPGASNSPRTIDVTYTVSQARVFFGGIGTQMPQATVGGADPAAKTIGITNAGAAALTGMTIGTTYVSGAATGWLDATLSGTTAPATMTLQAHTGTLVPGVYLARVTVDAPNAQPLSLDVRFTVLDAPTIGFQLAGSNSTTPTHAATVTQGGATTAPVTFVVQNRAGGTLDNLSVSSITYGNGEPTGWLSASLAGTTAPANLTISANHATLAPGTYTGQVWVNSPAAGNGPQAITYTLTVKAAPVLALSRTSVAATAMAGTTPPNEAIAITSSTGGAMTGVALSAITYAAGEPTGWLGASLNATNIPAGGSAGATLTFASSALAAGVYHASLAVSSPDAINGPQSIDVTLTVTRRPAIALSATTVPLNAVVGGATTAPVTVDVTNGGDNALTGLALGATQYGANGTGWLDARLSGTTAPATVTLRATPSGLAAGTYTAIVPVTSSASATANSPQSITVTLTVAPAPPVIAFAKPNVPLSIQVNALVARSTTVAVTNVGGGTLAGLAIAPIAYDGARTGWLAASLSGTTAPATLALRTQTRGVAAGYYTATLTMNGAGAQSATLPVGIEVVDLKVAEAALSDATKLDAAERARLDSLGNQDGTYNFGDYLALRTRLGLN